jgi:UDP-N-acetylglucosamine diphosphorylase / glucose-1-phosphate thymidylyltransferase / UDP-N-acetylgalactosamine diphosphorylase / glucosamine-1-phosphate N-acetyltransferase / galactosamine-1-phosphate N-acetyltransferase
VLRASFMSGASLASARLQKPLFLSVFFVIQAVVNASDFFALPASLVPFAPYFPADVAPWQWLKAIGQALESLNHSPPGPQIPPGVHIEGKVWIHPSVKLPAYATIIGPVYIGANTQIRPGAFIRGNVIAGEDCVLGNASEFKNCLLLDRVQASHFNYVGDSILGNGAHLGAGAICSNLRLDQGEVVVRLPSGPVMTGLKKFGAVLGDKAEVGCNAVLNPGTLLGPRALVMPSMAFSGYLPAGMIARTPSAVTTIARRD